MKRPPKYTVVGPCEHDPKGCKPCRAERRRINKNLRARDWAIAFPEKVAVIQKNWNERNPEKRRANQRKQSRKAAGMVFETDSSLETLVAQQNFCCAICGVDLRSIPNKQVHADHDHSISDGRPNVRGALCHDCNLLLGHAKDSKIVLQKALIFLDDSDRRLRQ